MTIRPQPYTKDLTNHMYGAIVSPETGEIMAKAGIGMLIIPQKPWADHHKDYVAYQEQSRAAGFEAKRPKAGCWVYCAATEAEARERGAVWLRNYSESALKHYEYLEPEHFKQAKGYEYYQQMAKSLGGNTDASIEYFLNLQVWGTPEMCFSKIDEIRSKVGADHFTGVFSYAGMPYDDAEKSLNLFAKEVMPELKKLNGIKAEAA
jgi:alkanesulfonate monooxygenase SsuD/methylene tetrahydromethanopterin reductase-like flavin-dependent oxidoreductase (luciferase family)